MKQINKQTFDLRDANNLKDGYTEISNEEFTNILAAKNAGCPLHVNIEGDVICGTSKFDAWSVANQMFEFNETAYVEAKQTVLKSDLENYRWSLNRGEVDGLPPVSYVRGIAIIHNDDARIRLDSSAANITEKGFDLSSDYDDFKDAFGNYPEGIVYGDVVGDTSCNKKSWRLMLGETEAILFNREKILRAEIDAMTTKEDVDGFNVVAKLDTLVKIVLMSDPNTFAYPIKYYNQDNQS